MRLSDRELLLVMAASLLTFLFSQDVSTQAHRMVARAAAWQGRPEIAEHHLRAALREAKRGSHVRARADDHYELARLYRRSGRLSESERELRRGLVSLGDDALAHTETRRRILLELVEMSQKAGLVRRAQRDAKALLAATEDAYGPGHLAVADVLETVAIVHAEAGRLDLAEEARRRSLSIREDALGRQDYAVGASMSALGGLLRARGRLKQAELYLEQSLAILEASGDPESPAWTRLTVAMHLAEPSRRHLLSPLNELGVLYRDQGRLGRAEATLSTALELAGPTGFATERSAILSNLSGVLRRRGSLEAAERRSLEALDIAEAAGLSHTHRAAVHRAVAAVYASQERYREARQHLERAARLAGTELLDGHPMLRATYANLSGPARDAVRALLAEGRLELDSK